MATTLYLDPMVRRFLANLSYIFLLNLLIKPLYIFGIEVQVQNVVGADEYGIYFALLNTAYLLQILNDFGLQIYNNRRVASDPEAVVSAFPGLLKSKLALGAAFFALLFLLGWTLGYNEWFVLLGVIGINLFLTSLVLFIRSAISGLGYYRQDSTFSVTDKVLMILICGAALLVFRDDFEVIHFALAQTASLAVTALAAGIFLYMKRPGRAASNAGREKVSELLKEAMPYALGVFLMTAYTRVDAVMVEQLSSDGEYQTGLYAAGYRLLDASNMVAYLFAVLLLPMFARLAADRIARRDLIGKSFRLMWTMTIVTAFCAFAFRQEIMEFLYTESTPVWGETFGILILSFIGVGSMYIFGTYMTAMGAMRRVNIAYGTCIAINVGLNAFLIPRYGANGAAWATLVTQSTVALWLAILAMRHLDARPDVLTIARLLLFACVAMGFAYVSQLMSAEYGGLLLIIPAAVVLLLLSVPLRIIDTGDVRGLLGK